MGPVKGEIQPEDRKNDRAIDAPRPHGMHRRPTAPTGNSRQVIKKMITAQGRKQKHSARKGNRRFHRGKGHTGCLSNKINPFCSSSCTGRNRFPSISPSRAFRAKGVPPVFPICFRTFSRVRGWFWAGPGQAPSACTSTVFTLPWEPRRAAASFKREGSPPFKDTQPETFSFTSLLT